MGVLDRTVVALAGEAGEADRLIIDGTHLKAHRSAASLPQKGLLPTASAGT